MPAVVFDDLEVHSGSRQTPSLRVEACGIDIVISPPEDKCEPRPTKRRWAQGKICVGGNRRAPENQARDARSAELRPARGGRATLRESNHHGPRSLVLRRHFVMQKVEIPDVIAYLVLTVLAGHPCGGDWPLARRY